LATDRASASGGQAPPLLAGIIRDLGDGHFKRSVKVLKNCLNA